MTERCMLLLVAGTVVALSVSAAAQHGQAGLFDESRTIEVRGAVKKWSFVNPHPVLRVEVTEKGATTEWDVYFDPSAMSFLRREGFSADTFQLGETVVVKGHSATTEGARGIDVWGKGTSVTRVDGRAIP